MTGTKKFLIAIAAAGLVLAVGLAYRFLHQTLFGEVTIPVRQETAEQRRVRFVEKRARLERDAAERAARDEEGDSEGV